jgi:hypothetical protein
VSSGIDSSGSRPTDKERVVFVPGASNFAVNPAYGLLFPRHDVIRYPGQVPDRSSAMIAQLGIHSSRSSMSLTFKLCVLSRNRCSDRMRDSNILWTGYTDTVRYVDEGVSRL